MLFGEVILCAWAAHANSVPESVLCSSKRQLARPPPPRRQKNIEIAKRCISLIFRNIYSLGLVGMKFMDVKRLITMIKVLSERSGGPAAAPSRVYWTIINVACRLSRGRCGCHAGAAGCRVARPQPGTWDLRYTLACTTGADCF